MDSYRQIRKKINFRNIQLKKQHGTNKISNCQGSEKESWKAINELLNKRSKSCLRGSGSETAHKKDISNAMNSFFCSAGTDLADKIDPAPNPLLAGDNEINKHKATFRFRTIEVREIRDAFATVKDKLRVDEIIVKKQPYQLLNTSREFFPNFHASNFHKLDIQSSKVRPNIVAILYFVRVCEGSIRRLAMWLV